MEKRTGQVLDYPAGTCRIFPAVIRSTLLSVALLGSCASGYAEDFSPSFAPWDVEQYRTGLVALTRADDHRTAILIFCTLIGTKNVVYAYDGRGQASEDIPISEARVRAISTIDVFGASMPSSAATFGNDGYIIRMQVPLPADFEPPQSGEMTLSSGADTAPDHRWSVTIGAAGLADAIRIAFQNCV